MELGGSRSTKKRLPKLVRYIEEHQAALTFNSLDSRATLRIMVALVVCISFLVLFSMTPTVICGSISFDQSGIGTDFSGVVLQIDGSDVPTLPTSISGGEGTIHTFSWLSPLIVNSTMQYAWASTSGGLTTAQSGNVSIPSGSDNVFGNYKTQYYVSVTYGAGGTVDKTNGFYDASIPTTIIANPNAGYAFVSWVTTGGVSVSDNSSATTTMTVTGTGSVEATFILLPQISFDQSGIGTDFSGVVLQIDGSNVQRSELMKTYSWAIGSNHTLSWLSPLTVSQTRYVWMSTSGFFTDQNGSITISGSGTLISNYKAQYFTTITAGAGGSVNLSSDWHDASSVVPITAIPSSGYAFTGWTASGGIVVSNPSSPTTTMTVNGVGSLSANFELLPIGVTFRQSGIGADFYGAVVIVDANAVQLSELMKTFSWEIGSNHTFSWLSPLTVSAEKRYVWVSTSGLSDLQSGTIDIVSDFGEVWGTYVAEYFVNIEPIVGGTVDLASGWYRIAQGDPISASPSANYQFSNWSTTGNVTIANPMASSTTFTVSGAGTIRANFLYIPQMVTVTFQASLGGNVSPSGSRSYLEGTSVDISASPSSGYNFFGWEVVGNATVSSPTSATTTLIVNGPAIVTANFSPIDYDPPDVTEITPPNGSQVAYGYVTIGASLSDETAIDTSSIVIKVDGIEWSGVQVASGRMTCTVQMQSGTHTVELVVNDTKGNSRSVTWTIMATLAPLAMPLELIAGIVISIVVVVMVISFLWLRRRKPEAVAPAGPDKKKVVR